MDVVDGTKGYKLQNSRELSEKVVQQSLSFNLTEEDFAKKGKIAGKLAGELKNLEKQFDEVRKEWKGKLDEKESELGTILSTIRKGEEDRIVKCIEQKDFKKHKVSYIFNGKVMHERELQLHERQMELVPGKKPGKETGKAGKLLPLNSDIKGVIREETSKKTKQDSSTHPGA